MKKVTRRQMERYPSYLKLLTLLKADGKTVVSSSVIAREMKCSEEQVRKDLQAVSERSGKPGVGRPVDETIRDLQDFLEKNQQPVVVVGVGRLGEALLAFPGFLNYGFNIVAGFDLDAKKVGKKVNGKTVYHTDSIPEKIPELGVKIAILSTSPASAQSAADALVAAGIRAFLNFVPVHIVADDSIVIENVDIAASLSMLSHRLEQKESRDAQED